MDEQDDADAHRSEPPAFNVPAAVLASALVLIAVHIGLGLLPWEERLSLLLTLAFIPARYTAIGADLPGGGLADITSFATYMLVHGSMAHLLINGLWMLAFGSAIAKRLGGRRFFAFSLFCGVAAALAHLSVHFGEAVPVVGASGAVSGHLAGAIRFLFGGRDSMLGRSADPGNLPLASLRETFTDRRILVFLGVWLAINALFGLGDLRLDNAGGGIAWVAHMGGFAAGLLGIGLFDSRTRNAPDRNTSQ